MHAVSPSIARPASGSVGPFRFERKRRPLDLLGHEFGPESTVLTAVPTPRWHVDAETGELVPPRERRRRRSRAKKKSAEGEGVGSLGTSTKAHSLSSQPAENKGVAVAVLAAKSVLQYPSDAGASRVERYALQSAVRDILPSSRTSHCCRSLVKGAQDVPISYSSSKQSARYCNVQTCGRLWTCPLCAARITEHRRAELVAAVARHRAGDNAHAPGFVYLVTRTFSHKPVDSLTDLMGAFTDAESRYKTGAPWVRLRSRFGIVGTIRAVEVTYGQNGWHPHIHELVFTRFEIDMSELRSAVFTRWHSVCDRVGLGLPTDEHGVDVRDGSYAAAYAGKWGIEAELTKAHVKRGRNSLTPWDLLRISVQCSDSIAASQSRALFAEYADAFHGKRQLVWSPGLDHIRDEELSDEEVAANDEGDAMMLGILSKSGWRQIIIAKKRGELLEVAASGCWSRVLQFLDEHRGPLAVESMTVDVGSRELVPYARFERTPKPDSRTIAKAVVRAMTK